MRILSAILFASFVCFVLARHLETTRANHLEMTNSIPFTDSTASNVESSTQVDQSVEHKPSKRWWDALTDIAKSLFHVSTSNSYAYVNGK